MSICAAQYLKTLQELFPDVWQKLDAAQPKGTPPGVFIRATPKTVIIPNKDAGPYEYMGPQPLFMFDAPKDVDPHAHDSYQNLLRSGRSPEDKVVGFGEKELIAMGGWRTTKLTYQFDEELLGELVSTPLAGDIPARMLSNLPADSFFLGFDRDHLPEQLAQIARDEGIGDGVFVSRTGNRLIICAPHSNSLMLDLDSDFNIHEIIDSSADRFGDIFSKIGRDQAQGDPEDLESNQKEVEDRMRLMRANNTIFWSSIMNALLYLSSDKPDIEHVQAPQARVTRLGNKVRNVAAKDETRSQVGARVGAVFRLARQERAADDGQGTETGRPALPHVRRAHWHLYWTGPRDSARTPILKWISPVLVNAQSHEDLDEVTHPVKRERLKA